MASLAGLLKAAGHTVTGSDENVYPPMSHELEALGIPYRSGFASANLEPRPDIVIVGNAISRGNVELEAVLNQRLRYTSAAAVIKEEFIRGRYSLAVAGTHGKTSTSSLLAWVLEAAGLNPAFLIGGVAENFGRSFRLTDSKYFVIEADEYDTAYFDKGPKMWHYLPDTAIVANIEFDHADIYRDSIAYNFAFSRFINLIPGNGTLVAGGDSEIVRELAAKSLAPVESFAYSGDTSGAGAHPRWRAEDVRFGPDGTTFSVLHDGERWGDVESPLAGAFSVRNILSVIAAAESVGADRERVREGLRTYKSVKRRMEVRGEARGVTVIDDFAHHPTAIRETIAAAKQKFAGRRIIAVYEPRSYTAQLREFEDAYEKAFAQADEIVLAGLFRPDRYGDTALDPSLLVDRWRKAGKQAAYVPAVPEIVSALEQTLSSGDVVLVMSNGGFGGLHDKLLEALKTPR